MRYTLTLTFRDGSQSIRPTDWPDAEEHLRNTGASSAKIERGGRLVAIFTARELEAA